MSSTQCWHGAPECPHVPQRTDRHEAPKDQREETRCPISQPILINNEHISSIIYTVTHLGALWFWSSQDNGRVLVCFTEREKRDDGGNLLSLQFISSPVIGEQPVCVFGVCVLSVCYGYEELHQHCHGCFLLTCGGRFCLFSRCSMLFCTLLILIPSVSCSRFVSADADFLCRWASRGRWTRITCWRFEWQVEFPCRPSGIFIKVHLIRSSGGYVSFLTPCAPYSRRHRQTGGRCVNV